MSTPGTPVWQVEQLGSFAGGAGARFDALGTCCIEPWQVVQLPSWGFPMWARLRLHLVVAPG